MEYLEKLANDNVFYTFDSDCVRKRSNMSKSHDAYKFDTSMYDPEKLLKSIPSQSPKLHKLLENIAKLDKKDMDRDGHCYKHFIFCDLKSGSYGAKMLASAFIATGKTLGYSAKRKDDRDTPDSIKTPKVREDTPRPLDKLPAEKLRKTPQLELIEEGEEEDSIKGGAKKMPKKKMYQKIEFLSPAKLRETQFDNFFLLSSVDVYDQTISVKDKKHILQTFNARPENVHGENIRFIIMDSGFKEGIDLFDIKYVHIFEPPVNSADKKQVIGRGTRTCGQKGLDFHPTRGWPLHVYVYDLEIPESLQNQFMGSKTAMEIYLQSLHIDIRLSEFTSDLEKTVVYGAVDHDLTKNIHSFTIDEEGMEDDGDRLLGGGPKRKPEIRVSKKLVVDRSKPILVIGSGSQEIVLPSGQTVTGMELRDMTFEKMREYVRDTFSHCSWKDVKMEDQCGTSAASASNDGVIEYTPTQRFIQEYFTPHAPVKGMLLWHSVGTGKTCSAIAAATASFVNQGYTILWVTRTTLKNDIWKNMFDQICNEQIRKMVRDGVKLPKEHEKRMRLLSKAWKIRPMSYKQFSNLVSKENDYYRKLVGMNGSQDPLRKTLLIIDEAHKLYGGGDLSSLERPDMKALHKALMNSYAMSGRESVRLLLMTATPITENPMEMNQLINLCKDEASQIPDEFDRFSLEYLDDSGKFTDSGRTRYLDDIAGYVSYLNREKDARQFAQPKLHYVNVPLVKDVKEVEAMDRRYIKSKFLEEQEKLQKEIAKENEGIEEDMRDLDKTRFYAIKDVCMDYEGKVKKACEKIANKNIKLLVNELKAITLHVKENVKQLKVQLRAKKQDRSERMKLQKEYLKGVSEEEKKQFQDSSYYMLKYKCGKKTVENVTMSEFAKTHPDIHELDEKIHGHNENGRVLEERMKQLTAAYKKKVKELKDLLRKDLSDLERNVVKSVLNDTMNVHRKTMKETRKEVAKDTASNNKLLNQLQKTRKKRMMRLRKIVKSTRKESNAAKKQKARDTKALRKTLRIQGELREEFQGDFMKEKIQTYQKETEDEFSKIQEALQEEHDRKMEAKEMKEEARAEKQRARAEKKQEKENEKKREKKEKEKEKAEKKKEKEREKETRKKREKEGKDREKETRRNEKIRIKSLKKTIKKR